MTDTAISSTTWIREVAQPYLRGYRATAASDGLRGYWFLAPTRGRLRRGARASRDGARPAAEIGFFVGYLTDSAAWSFLPCAAPECAVFAFVRPTASAAHRDLVAAEGALVRRTFTYIRWLTHRPPRFQFFDGELPALIRHRPLADWPRERHQHFARNFFIETLAWLVRSGLVRKLTEAAQAAPRVPKRNQAQPRAARKRNMRGAR